MGASGPEPEAEAAFLVGYLLAPGSVRITLEPSRVALHVQQRGGKHVLSWLQHVFGCGEVVPAAATASPAEKCVRQAPQQDPEPQRALEFDSADSAASGHSQKHQQSLMNPTCPENNH